MTVENENIVSGRKMACSINDLVERCECYIQEENAKLSPDNGLIETLCDAVRFVREQCDNHERMRWNSISKKILKR